MSRHLHLANPLHISLLALAGLTLVAVATCCTTPPSQAYPQTVPGGRTPDEQVRSAAEILGACVAPNGQVSLKAGSGVIVSESSVVTAAHVVSCPGTIAIIIQSPLGERKADLSVVDHDGDIAVLRLAEPVEAPHARVGPKPRLDERVCLVAALPTRARRCGGVERWDGLPGDVKHHAITEPGNSGSGVYDDGGRLVGIVTHFYRCSSGQLCGGFFTSLAARPWVMR